MATTPPSEMDIVERLTNAADGLMIGVTPYNGLLREAADLIDRLRHAAPEWQPIGTAPKDGRDIILCADPKRFGKPVSITYWDNRYDCWFHWRYVSPPVRFVGWMPITLPDIAGERNE